MLRVRPGSAGAISDIVAICQTRTCCCGLKEGGGAMPAAALRSSRRLRAEDDAPMVSRGRQVGRLADECCVKHKRLVRQSTRDLCVKALGTKHGQAKWSQGHKWILTHLLTHAVTRKLAADQQRASGNWSFCLLACTFIPWRSSECRAPAILHHWTQTLGTRVGGSMTVG